MEEIAGQTTFNLPPHGPVVFAASLPDYVDVSFTDENVEEIDFNEDCDIVSISMMLSTQVKRGWEIADCFRKQGKSNFRRNFYHVACRRNNRTCRQCFLGESEGRMEEVFNDFKAKN